MSNKYSQAERPLRSLNIKGWCLVYLSDFHVSFVEYLIKRTRRVERQRLVQELQAAGVKKEDVCITVSQSHKNGPPLVLVRGDEIFRLRYVPVFMVQILGVHFCTPTRTNVRTSKQAPIFVLDTPDPWTFADKGSVLEVFLTIRGVPKNQPKTVSPKHNTSPVPT